MPNPNTLCKLCGKRFYAKPNWLRKGKGKYCSRTCQSESRKKGKAIPCYNCGKETWKTPKDFKHSKSGRLFCSKSCMLSQLNTRCGPDHPNWKGGEYVEYKKIMEKNKKQICRKCKKTDKRILLVHHLDRKRSNNNLNNLVWLCYNCHHLVHNYNEYIP